MDLSILLPLSNHLELTRECLASLERTTRGARWEVILVDDATIDGTREFLRGLRTSRHRALFNEGVPRGTAACLNAAARVARGGTLCALSPAAVLLPGWLQPMLRLLQRLPGAGCVGSVHREPISGLIDHTGVIFDVRGLPTDAGRSTVSPPVETYTRWPAVSASCCVARRRLHEQLGGFDEALALELSGIDFCLRASERAGARHYTANRSVIYLHRGNPAGGNLPEGGPQAAEPVDGRQHFEDRWGARARAYQRWEQTQLAAERDADRSAAARGDLSRHLPPEMDAEHWEDLFRARERLWHRRWELARENRRQGRQDITDGREDGWRYLSKHATQPWRYNWGRLGQAMVKVFQPRPVAISRPPPYPRTRHAGNNHHPRGDSDSPGQVQTGHPDAPLFNPPAE